MKQIINGLIVIVCLGIGIAAFNTGCAGDRYHRSTGTYIDDTAIGAKVKVELLGDPDVKGTAIHVEVHNGNVQLSGFVDSAAQKTRAGEIAHHVNGVQSVRNDLVVK